MVKYKCYGTYSHLQQDLLSIVPVDLFPNLVIPKNSGQREKRNRNERKKINISASFQRLSSSAPHRMREK